MHSGFGAGQYAPPPDSGRDLWGIYTFALNPESGEIDIIPDRQLSAHFNVTSLLNDPMTCPMQNCITIQLTGKQPGGIFNIAVTLRNPTTQMAYDVRGIFVDKPGQHELTNPDNYTDLWFGKPNPFRAFAKSAPKRQFPPAAVYTEDYYIHFPGPPYNFNVTYAIDISWPKNCKEPFWIKDIGLAGKMTPKRGCVLLSLKCYDWNGADDVESVEADTTPLNGNLTSLEHKPGTNDWDALILNSYQATVGEYECLIQAKSYDSPLYLYDYVTIEVTEPVDDSAYQGVAYDNVSDAPLEEATITTSDGKALYTADTDECGVYALDNVPQGKRVITFSKPYYITTHYSTLYEGQPIELDGYLEPTPDAPPPLPEVSIAEPDVDYEFGEASVTGTVENLDCSAAVICVNQQEYLLAVDEMTHEYFYIVVLEPGINVIRVRATNATGSIFSDEKYIDNGQPEYPFQVKLTWDKINDQDLHGWDPDFQHCYYLYMDIPTMSLDIDIIDEGYGPEHITAADAAIPGRYYFAVNYYLEHYDYGPTICTVDIILNPGTAWEEKHTFQHTLNYGDENSGYPIYSDNDSWWRVCDIVLDDDLKATWEAPDTSVALWE